MASRNRSQITRRWFMASSAASVALLSLEDFLARDAFAQTVRTRAALETSEGQRNLRLYRRAVTEMRGDSLPAHDPKSWSFQANIHDYPENEDIERIFRNRSSNATIRQHYELAIGGGGKAGIWRTCSHFHPEGNIHFLSWHRMYLYFFERIVERIVDEPFAMPYWNYTNPAQRRIPDAFRRSRLTGGGSNRLYLAARQADFLNSGLPADATRAAPALSETRLLRSTRGFNSAIETRPHNVIHGAVGTAEGMGDTPRAARDPLFWVHHAAVDRFWESWRFPTDPRQPPANGVSPRDPTQPPSWQGKPYSFAAHDGARVELTVGDFLKRRNLLNVKYDRLETMPTGGGLAFGTGSEGTQVAATQLSKSTGGGGTLSAKGQSTTLEFAPSVPGSVALGFDRNPNTFYDLVVDVAVSKAAAGLYEVYVAVPTAPGSSTTEEVKVDTFSLFGAAHGTHGGKTQWRADVTALVRQGKLDPKKPGKVSVKVTYGDPGTDVRITGVGIEAE